MRTYRRHSINQIQQSPNLLWLSFFAPVLLIACASAGIAAGTQREFFLKGNAGEFVYLGGHSRRDGSCAPIQPPLLLLVVAPKHGTVCARAELVRGILDSMDNLKRKCLGRTVAGVKVFYQSFATFDGTDTVGYQVRPPKPTASEREVNWTLHINVKARSPSGYAEDRNAVQQDGDPIPPCPAYVS